MLKKCFISLLMASIIFYTHAMEQAVTIPNLKHLAMDCLWSQGQALKGNDKISQELVEEFKEYKETQFLKAIRESNLCEFEKHLLVNIFDAELWKKNVNFYRYLYVKCRYLYEIRGIKLYKKILIRLQGVIDTSQKFMKEPIIKDYFSCENKQPQRFIEALFAEDVDAVKECLLDETIDDHLVIIGMLVAATQGNTSILLALGKKIDSKYSFATHVWILSQCLSLAIHYNKQRTVKYIMARIVYQADHPDVREMFYEALCTSIRCGNRIITELLCESHGMLIKKIATHPEGTFDLIGLARALENSEIVELLNDRLEENSYKTDREHKEVKSLRHLAMDYCYEHQMTLGHNVPEELIEEFTNYKKTWQFQTIEINKNFSEFEQDFLMTIAQDGKNNLQKDYYGLYFFKYVYLKCKYLASLHASPAYRFLIEILEQNIPECISDYYSSRQELQGQMLSCLFGGDFTKGKELFQSGEKIKHDSEFIILGLAIAVAKRDPRAVDFWLDYLISMCKNERITNVLLGNAIETALMVAIGHNYQDMATFLLGPYEYPAQVSQDVFYKSLTKCIHFGRTEIARLILQRYSLLDARDNGNNTDFLATAVARGNLPMVKLFIAQEADHGRPDLLLIAVKSENVALVKFLVEKYDLSNQIDQALNYAMNQGSVAIVKYFIDVGLVNSSIPGFNKCMTTALGNFAIRNPKADLDEYARSLGIDKSIINEALFGIASFNGDVATLRYLIDKEGIKEPGILRLGLQTAFLHDHEDAMNYLIKLGVHLEEKPIQAFKDLRTSALAVSLFNVNAHLKLLPKMLVLEQYSSELIERLLTVDDLHIVAVQNVKYLMEYLESPSQAFIEHVFTNGLEQGNIPLIEYFLTNKFDNIRWHLDDNRLTTAIEQADGFGQEELKNYLVEYQQEQRRKTRMAAIEKRLQGKKETN